MPDIQIYDSPQALTQAAMHHIITLADDAINQRGRFTIALSGGSTPKPVYEQLAARKDQIDWSKVHIFWSDERSVPPNHPDSNYHMAHEALLRHIENTCGNIHRMRGEIDPQQAAEQYENVLKTTFSVESPPHFDLILLGMGDDAHTASLFPHTPAIHEMTRWVVANYVEKLSTWRITFTAPLINVARNVTFLIAGEKKAQPLRQVLQGDYNPDVYPSQLVKPTDGSLVFLLDSAAGQAL